ncbi:MAG: beta-lactamase family protein [Caldilineaceae bacterium]|nr:beta-lactamase family protein [Caldilineaceae bacterium]
MPRDFTHLSRLLTSAAETVAPAIACRVEQRGEVLFDAGFGVLNPASATGSTQPDTIFDLASLTKLFTTTAFLRLVDAGAVTVDQPVADVVPAFGGQRIIGGSEDPISKRPLPADPRWGGQIVDADAITFRHLLTHTSGLPAWRGLYRICGPVPAPVTPTDEDIAHRHAAALDAIAGFPFLYPTGADYVYSDVGLILLGFAVERLHGARLDVAIHDLVSAPLGLSARYNPPADTHSHIAPTEDDPWRQRRLRGEVHDENAAGLGGIAGHAGLFGTTADLCRLGALYLNRGEDLLSPALAAESTRPQNISAHGVRRGLGWLLRSDPDPSCSTAFSPSTFGHTGYTGTSLWCDPLQDIAVALFTNRVYHGREPSGIAALRPQVHSCIADALA